ncbi:MAG: DNA-3-methyladenine glycosylase [Verrucomicrobia bacterium]|nr:DNA-3-methyladenine glycosylase [Verrucomicrobiota bacterium]
MESKRLPSEFYRRDDVVAIARDLLGKHLFTTIDGKVTGGIITETEAYAGPTDRASHAYNNRRTARTEVMFHHGGIAYVYLCYGIHHLLNVVTNTDGIPHAVLIRGIYPTVGIETMLVRRDKDKLDHRLTNGPGSVCQALGINMRQNGISFDSDSLWIEEGVQVPPDQVVTSARIGIDYAGEDAFLPWRFFVPDKIFI